MQFRDTAAANERRAALTCGVGVRSELDELRSLCRSQALAIDVLAQAASALRRGAALTADHAALRAERDRPPSGRRPDAPAPDRRVDAGRALVVRLPCDARAPGAARIVVTQRLRDGVATGVLASAVLLVSELVSNSVCHSGADPEGVVIVGVGCRPRRFASRSRVGAAAASSAPVAQIPSTAAASASSSCNRSASAGLVDASTPAAPTSERSCPRARPRSTSCRRRPRATWRSPRIPIDQRAVGPQATPAGRTP